METPTGETEMNAIDWMKDKAITRPVEFITVSADEADCADEVGTYKITRKAFSGFVPYRMMKEAMKSPLVKTASTVETLLVDMKKNHVEFSVTEYEKVGA